MYKSRDTNNYNNSHRNTNTNNNNTNNSHRNNYNNNSNKINNTINIKVKTDIIPESQDYMFTSKNLIRYTKHMIQPKDEFKPKDKFNSKDEMSQYKNDKNEKVEKREKETIYKPKQKDSLFWCFYILKHGYSNYEMEINNQYFVVEKNEKFKYIELIRKKKDILKIHKIKPFTEIEDDLANKDKISIKTFFALCILENINVLLVDKRKIFEITCIDIDETHPVNIVHRSNQFDHHIELNVTDDMLQKYRDTYYKMSSFDATLKSMASYKTDELIDLCKKLNINIEMNKKDLDKMNLDKKKKMTKKDIYELLVLNY